LKVQNLGAVKLLPYTEGANFIKQLGHLTVEGLAVLAASIIFVHSSHHQEFRSHYALNDLVIHSARSWWNLPARDDLPPTWNYWLVSVVVKEFSTVGEWCWRRLLLIQLQLLDLAAVCVDFHHFVS
jgi:hypothetical protein